MKVYNENKTEELTEYDLTKGKLVEDTIIVHYPAVEGQELEDYVIDGVYTIVKPYIKAEAEHTEEESIYRYIPYTESELTEMARQEEERALQEEKNRANSALLEEKATLTNWLKEHDYIGIKIATGRASIEDYSSEIETMKQYAERINEINAELEGDN